MLCCTRLCARLTATTIKHSKCPMSTATNTIERPLSLEERLQLLETMPDQLKGKIIEEPDWTNIDVMLAEDVEHTPVDLEDETSIKVREPLADGSMYATGRRKSSVARVFLHPNGTGKFSINKTHLYRYFHQNDTALSAVLTPFVVTRTIGKYDVVCTVEGGGNMGQANAVRHGIATALRYIDPSLRIPLKRQGLLTSDSRRVEKKKAGLKKARKAKQWVKR